MSPRTCLIEDVSTKSFRYKGEVLPFRSHFTLRSLEPPVLILRHNALVGAGGIEDSHKTHDGVPLVVVRRNQSQDFFV